MQCYSPAASRLSHRRSERLGATAIGPGEPSALSNRAGVRMARPVVRRCTSTVAARVTSGGLRRTIARRSPTVSRRCATHACGSTLTVSDGDLDPRPARGSAGSGPRRGVSTPRCERAPGSRAGSPEPYRSAHEAPSGLHSVPRRGFVTGAALGGEGAPLRGHQRAIVTPDRAQIVSCEDRETARRCHASVIWSIFGAERFKHGRLRLGDGHPRGQESTASGECGPH
jgi:hypothetical protein